MPTVDLELGRLLDQELDRHAFILFSLTVIP